MLRLSWAEFDAAADHIAARIPPGVSALYGVPRGGLCLAVAVSHRAGLPLAEAPRPGVLIVDEIADSGRTLAALRAAHGDLPAAVWIVRAGCAEPALAVRCAPPGEWVVFPWEVAADAEKEAAAYAER